MRTEWVYRRCPRYLRRLIENHWSERRHRVERLLSHFQGNVCELQASVHRIDHPRQYEGRMVLRLPTATIRVESRKLEALSAIDDLMDQLVRRINRHVERLRKDWPARRAAVNRAALPASGQSWLDSLDRDSEPVEFISRDQVSSEFDA